MSNSTDKDLSNLNFSCVVNKPRGWLDQTLVWCQQEIKSEWRWQMIRSSDNQHPGVYKFYFSNEKDLLTFIISK
jgi:hypothetical protein